MSRPAGAGSPRLRVPSAGLVKLALIAGLLLGLLAAAVPADAAVRTVVLRHGPVELGGFETKLPKVWVARPKVDGYVVGMDARLVYGNGRRVSIRQVMLHHLVFLNHGPGRRSSCAGRRGEPFWGTGEERQRLILPRGYGYRIRRGERWRMQAMLMSHTLRRQRVYVEYTVRIVTGRRLRGVRPLWLRANGCSRHPSYDVNGEGGRHRKAHTWRIPYTGRIVAAGAHLHGGAHEMRITQPRCRGRTLVHHAPRYGLPNDLVYRLRPILHEPGPIATGYFLSRTGIPVRRGERLRVSATYDHARPHPSVMAITHVYIATGPAPRPKRACPRLPADRRVFWTRRAGRSEPPVVRVPLTAVDAKGRLREIDRPPGREHVRAGRATVRLRDNRFIPANLSVDRGAIVTWRWLDPFAHNVLLASGPRNVASSIKRRGGRYVKRLSEPGEYRLFCYLHPVSMHQVIRVR